MILKRLSQYALGFLLVSILLSSSCEGGTLLDLVDRARDSEPTYLGSKAELEAVRARQEQAEAAFYPQITASGSASQNNRKSQTEATMFSSGETNEFYNAASAQLNLTQPLFRSPSVVAIRQSKNSVSQYEFKLETTEGELYVKVVAAWLDILASRDNSTVARQQVLVTKQQWEMFRRGLELGTTAQPQAAEAQMKYEQSVAEYVLAGSDQSVKRATLEQLVGKVGQVSWPYLRTDAVLFDLNAGSLETWLELTTNNNASIRSAQMAYVVAKAETEKQYAGHLPTLDLVGSYGENIQGAGTSPGQSRFDNVQWSIGLQVNVSIYGGGAQSSKVKEAISLQNKAGFDLELARRGAELATKQAWYSWQAASAKARAAKQAMQAAESALKLAKTGVSKGLKTEFDVLQAEQQSGAARRDFNKASYDQLLSIVKLKVSAGVFAREDLVTLDSLFVLSDPSAIL